MTEAVEKMLDSPEATVEEQVALMYLGTVDEARSNAMAQEVIMMLAPPDASEPPKNADVLYALVTLLTVSMLRMSGTTAFKQTILRGFGDLAAGQLALREARAREKAETKDSEVIPKSPKPYTELATTDDDVYTVEDFRQAVASGAFADDDGVGRQGTKLGADVIYYSHDKRHVVKPSDFSGPDEKQLLKGTSHIVWFNR